MVQESINQGTWRITDTEVAITVPMWTCTRSSAYVLLLLDWCFGDMLDSRSGGVYDTFVCFGNPFPPTEWLHLDFMRRFVPSLCILFCHVWLMSLGDLLSSEGRLRGNGSGEEGKRGASVWGAEKRGKCDLDVIWEKNKIWFLKKVNTNRTNDSYDGGGLIFLFETYKAGQQIEAQRWVQTWKRCLEEPFLA